MLNSGMLCIHIYEKIYQIDKEKEKKYVREIPTFSKSFNQEMCLKK